MVQNILEINSNEKSIKENNPSSSKKINIDYKNKICTKPWGYEFMIYNNTKIAIWFLKINSNHKTSLHMHYYKDTLLVTYKGTGLITYKDTTDNLNHHILNELEYLFIPKYKFHQLSGLTEAVYFIEIEIFSNDINFSDKNDLLRIDDIYNRDSTGYESSIICLESSYDLKNYDYFYLDNLNFNLTYLDNLIEFKSLTNYDINCKKINILIEGQLYNNDMIVKEGSILKLDSNTQLLSNDIKVLSLYSYEKKKIQKLYII